MTTRPLQRRIEDCQTALAVIANDAYPCFLGTEEGRISQPTQVVSCTGGNFCGKPGEAWPTTERGTPLIPWLQVVCKEIRGGTGPFHKRKAICIFIDPEFTGFDAFSTRDLSPFVVREYGPSDRLVALKRPDELNGHPFRRVKWKQSLDYPHVSRFESLFDHDVIDQLHTKNPFPNQTGIKVGGWPTPIHGRQKYPGRSDLQIDVTENFMYGDSGIGFLSHHGDRWHLYFETC